MLTRQQHALLTFIDERLSEGGVSPSFEEMRLALGLKSKSGIHRLVVALEERGFLRRLPNRARALEVRRRPEAKTRLRVPRETERTLRVAICIPVYGMTHAKFTQSLANMLVFSLGADVRGPDGEPVKLELETFMVSCSMLTESRHRLVAEALAAQADYMLCLDADHVFPPDTLVRLLAHGLPAVGANYPRRFAPTAPTAAIPPRALLGEGDHPQDGGGVAKDSGKDDDDPRALLYTTRELATRGLVEPVAHLGFGVLLLDMRVFDALQAQAEKDGDGNFLPLFKFEPTPDKVGMIGEDVFFFRKLAAAGIRPFVDHRLSWEVGHLFEILLTNGHALAQRDRWADHIRNRARKFEAQAEAIEAQAGDELGEAV